MTDIKNCIEISTTRGDNVYTFHIASGAPWGELFDASYEIHQKVAELVRDGIKNAVSQAESTQNSETSV